MIDKRHVCRDVAFVCKNCGGMLKKEHMSGTCSVCGTRGRSTPKFVNEILNPRDFEYFKYIQGKLGTNRDKLIKSFGQHGVMPTSKNNGKGLSNKLWWFKGGSMAIRKEGLDISLNVVKSNIPIDWETMYYIVSRDLYDLEYTVKPGYKGHNKGFKQNPYRIEIIRAIRMFCNKAIRIINFEIDPDNELEVFDTMLQLNCNEEIIYVSSVVKMDTKKIPILYKYFYGKITGEHYNIDKQADVTAS